MNAVKRFLSLTAWPFLFFLTGFCWSLTESLACDYVILVHEDLMCSSVNDLINLRESQGYTACIDTIQDGNTFDDIKTIISDYYHPANNPDQPLCVILIGDAAGYDTLWMIANSQVGNYIPSYWMEIAYPHTIDEAYVCVDNNEPTYMKEPLFPDIYIGRIPASSTSDVEVFVRKLLDYEYNSGDQEWKDNVLLIAGDMYRAPGPPQMPSPEEVNEVSENIVDEIVPSDWESNILYYSDAPADARQDSLSDNLNSGQLLMSALGTAANHRILCYYVSRDSLDGVPPFDAAADLDNYPMYPVVYGASCDMGRVDEFDFAGNRNLYENFLFTDSVGVIAWIAPTGATAALSDNEITGTFYRSVFETKVLDIGRLNYITKLEERRNGTARFLDLQQYSIYGDPAMTLSVNSGFAATFASMGFELVDPRAYQNRIYISQNITGPNARIIPEQYAVEAFRGQRIYKVSGNDGSPESSKIFWELLDESVPVNQDRRFLTFFMYVAESPGDLRHIYVDAIIDSSNWMHEYAVFDQYGHGAAANNVPDEPGIWKYYALDLTDLYGHTITKLLVGYDDGADTSIGDFLAYLDEIRFQPNWGKPPIVGNHYHPYTFAPARSDTLSISAFDPDVWLDFGDTIHYAWSTTLGTLIDENTRKPTYSSPDSIVGAEPVDTIICNLSDNGFNVVADTMFIYYGQNGGIIYDGHGGPLKADEVESPYYMLADAEVPAGCTLTLDVGSIAKFGDSTEFRIGGSLQVDGNIAHNVVLTSISDSGAGDWYGLRFKPGSIGDLEYCAVQNAVIGINMDGTSEASLTKCLIEDMETYGMYITQAAALIDSCDFEACANYGIYVDGDPVGARDSIIIQYCKIETGDGSIPAPSQYCVYSIDADKIRIENNLLRAYNQGGIGLYNSSAQLQNNQIHNCVYYGIKAIQNSDAFINSCALDTLNTGIYALSGSDPKVRWCEFQNLNIGVKDIGSTPDLGRITGIMPADTGYNDLEDCTQYYIHHFPSPYHYWAEGNYFGSTGPDTNKFVGGPDYDPWLKKDPYPKKDDESEIPLAYKMNPNYPNPFNANTVISFSLAEAGHTKVAIYNILGQKITTLLDDYRPPGDHLVMWDGKNDNGEPVSTGIYLYRIESGSFVEAKKMTLIR